MNEEEAIQKVTSFSETFVYKVPPISSGFSGHRAEQWNLESPFSTGACEIFSKGEAMLIKLSSPEKGLIANITIQLATDAQSPESKVEYWMEQTKDSSRYFVLRIQEGSRKALIGLGFRERNAAFEFQEAVMQHFKRVLRWRGLSPAVNEGDEEEEDTPAPTPVVAASNLKLTGPIKLNIPVRQRDVPFQKDAEEDWGDFQG